MNKPKSYNTTKNFKLIKLILERRNIIVKTQIYYTQLIKTSFVELSTTPTKSKKKKPNTTASTNTSDIAASTNASDITISIANTSDIAILTNLNLFLNIMTVGPSTLSTTS